MCSASTAGSSYLKMRVIGISESACAPWLDIQCFGAVLINTHGPALFEKGARLCFLVPRKKSGAKNVQFGEFKLTHNKRKRHEAVK